MAAVSADGDESGGWRLSLTLSRAAFEALEAALADHADAVVAETVAAAQPARDAPDDTLRATLFGTAPAADDARPARLVALLRESGAEAEPGAVEPVPNADWGAQSLASFPPLAVGCFTIRGTHQADPWADPRADPWRRFALSIDAGAAFGSGRHETTQGCLLALGWLARRRRVRVAFDIGTGSGILAVAAARLWPARVIAVDSDPMAVATARATVRRNALSRRVAVRAAVVQGAGFRVRGAARPGRADLIVANIRARPLAAMAAAFARHLRPGGVLVLSGLLAAEESLVLSAFRTVRLRLRHRVSMGAWVTLILTR